MLGTNELAPAVLATEPPQVVVDDHGFARAQTRQHLVELYGGLDSDLDITLCYQRPTNGDGRKPPFKVEYFKAGDIEELIDRAEALGPHCHQWVSVGGGRRGESTDRNGRTKLDGRLRGDTVTELDALFIDAEAAIDGHHSTSASEPPSKAELLGLIRTLPVEPSRVIDSGGGYHVYWYLDAPLTGNAIRPALKILRTAIEAFASKTPWSKAFDTSVIEPARVLRLAGSVNVKVPVDPKPVVIVAGSGLRFPAQDLLNELSTMIPKPAALEPAQDPSATPRGTQAPRNAPPQTPAAPVERRLGRNVEARIQGALDQLDRAPNGTRNTTANQVAHVLGRLAAPGSWSEQHAGRADELLARWLAVVEPQSTKGQKALEAIFWSGFEAGQIAGPLDPPRDRPVGSATTLQDLETADGRQTVVVDPDPKTASDQLLEIMDGINTPEPRIFARALALVTTAPDEDGRTVIQSVTRPLLSSLILDNTQLVRIKKVKGEGRTVADMPVSVRPSRDAIDEILATAAGDGSRIPPLVGVTTFPTLSRIKGEYVINDADGYNRHTRLVNVGEHVAIPRGAPTDAELALAVALLEELVCDFPFVLDNTEGPTDDNGHPTTSSSRTNHLAYLLSPFVRPAIDGNVPLFVLDAPSIGSGKSLLQNVVTTLLDPSGQSGQLTWSVNSDEMGKRILATLRGGPAHIVIDNVSGVVKSEQLARVLSSRFYEGRVLGFSEQSYARNTAVWSMSGNNLDPDLEIARRSVWCRIDAKSERPWEREEFRHPDLLGWVRQRRPDLIRAAFTLIRHWIAQGSPDAPGKRLGSFEPLRRAVGGVLFCAGIDGFLGNRAKLYDSADYDRAVWVELAQLWHEAWRTSPVVAVDIAKIHDENDLGILTPDGSRGRKMGKALAEKRDMILGGLIIEQVGTKKRSKTWRVRLIGESSHG